MFITEVLNGQNLPSACGNSKVRYRMRGQPGSSFLWTVLGGEQTAYYASGDSIDVLWNNSGGNHSLSCQELVVSGCSGPTITANVDIVNTLPRKITRSYVCRGQTIELRAAAGFTRYQWLDGSTGSTFIAKSPGVYWVDVGQGKCTLRDTILVVLAPSPIVNLGRDTFVCAPNHLLLDAGNPGMDYEWSTGNHAQTVWVHEGDGLLWVKVTNDNNCSSTDSINIKPCSPLNYLLVPNVFTPNDDGINDVWRIGGLQYFLGTVVKLFDRWGRLVFLSEPGYPKPWDGRRNGKLLPIDAYYYVIDLNNGGEPLRGSVTLIP